MDCEEDKPGHKCRKHLFTLCVRLFRPHDSKSSVHKKVFYIYTEITLLFSPFLFILFLSLTKTIVKLLQVGDIFHPGSSELLIYLLYKLMSFFFFLHLLHREDDSVGETVLKLTAVAVLFI